MSDKDVMKWLAGIFVVFVLMALWVNMPDGPECENTQYSTQSC